MADRTYRIPSNFQSPLPGMSSLTGAAFQAGKTTPPLFASAGAGWAGARRAPAMPPQNLGAAVRTGYAGRTNRPRGKYL